MSGGEYVRDVAINEPGMVGARWWNKSLIAYDKSVSRRRVLKGIAIVGGLAVFIGLAVKGAASASDGDDDTEAANLQLKKSLEMQKTYGWDFGARGQMLVYDGTKLSPFDASKIAELGGVMTPQDPDHKAFSRLTLTEALGAQPTATLPPDPNQTVAEPKFVPLKDVITPIESVAMKSAYAAGESLARYAGDRQTIDGKRLGLLVDMFGPESVAFAAGAAEVFEPVLLFDNWPHPKGVVASHNALAALAFYQPRFTSTRVIQRRWPAFLLDRARHATYSESSDKFDNRYYARFPTAEALRARDITQILYVVSGPSALPEPTDLNWPLADLASGAKGGAVGARALSASDFRAFADKNTPPKFRTYFGGQPETDTSIWAHYPVFKDPPAVETMMGETAATKYRFLRQASATQTEPANYGVVGVMVAATTGVIIAAALDRAGSMNRFSGGWSG